MNRRAAERSKPSSGSSEQVRTRVCSQPPSSERWRRSDPHALAAGHDEGRGAGAEGKIRYTTSKLCNVYFARELARRLERSTDERLRSIRVAAFDPGMMPGTGLARDYDAVSRFMWAYALPLLTLTGANVNTVSCSAQRLVALFTEGTPSWPNGGYISRGVPTPPSNEALNDRHAAQLWQASESLLQAALERSRRP